MLVLGHVDQAIALLRRADSLVDRISNGRMLEVAVARALGELLPTSDPDQAVYAARADELTHMLGGDATSRSVQMAMPMHPEQAAAG
jgi:uncharacterized protein HemX